MKIQVLWNQGMQKDREVLANGSDIIVKKGQNLLTD
jgi:hypothetical protein